VDLIDLARFLLMATMLTWTVGTIAYISTARTNRESWARLAKAVPMAILILALMWTIRS